mmetsp:Transcript_55797/g.154465  ORF Transcript_55797/g.154465 Transcript_55797/m.154465 type:complete len:209 (+) Transcript_55797:350-976(+)
MAPCPQEAASRPLLQPPAHGAGGGPPPALPAWGSGLCQCRAGQGPRGSRGPRHPGRSRPCRPRIGGPRHTTHSRLRCKARKRGPWHKRPSADGARPPGPALTPLSAGARAHCQMIQKSRVYQPARSALPGCLHWSGPGATAPLCPPSNALQPNSPIHHRGETNQCWQSAPRGFGMERFASASSPSCSRCSIPLTATVPGRAGACHPQW